MNVKKNLFETQFHRTLEYLETDIESNVSNVNEFKTKSWSHILELGLYRAICYFLT